MRIKHLPIAIVLFLLFTNPIQSQWERQTSGLPSDWTTGWSIDACNGYNAIVALHSAPYPLYNSSDGGANWLPVEINIPDIEYINDLEMINSTHFVAVSSKQIIVSFDGGATWESKFHDENLTTFLNYIEMFDDNDGIAMGDAVDDGPVQFLKTTDGGLTWTSVNTASLLGANSGDTWRRLDFINPEIGYFYPTIYGAGNQIIFKTTDSGETWNETGFFGVARGMKFYDENIGLTYDWGEIRRTTDGGQTWETFTTSMTGCGMDFVFEEGNPNNVWFTCGDDVYYSDNMGTSWTKDLSVHFEDESILYNDMVFTDPQHGWLLCTDGYLFHYGDINTSIEDAKDNAVPNEITLYQNYPNPFNPSTTISFMLSSASFTLLKIYNSVGEEIETLVADELQSGIHNVTFNASDLASGIYFYKLESGNFSETKKLILLK